MSEAFEGKNILRHVAIIMDGNRRWARKNILSTFFGHHRGYEKLKEVAQWCADEKISFLTVYAFSTENWSRPEDEVSYLMELMRKALRDDAEEYIKKCIRIRVLGETKHLPQDIRELIFEIEKKTRNNASLYLQIALSYGGRTEILRAVEKICQEKMSSREKNFSMQESDISSRLWTNNIPDPDLVIRTGGEQRLSNFLTWQSVYSELYFTPVLWPDFSREDFSRALEDFQTRKRNFGR